jgi:NADH-quinone oxidoreductase subunit A
MLLEIVSQTQSGSFFPLIIQLVVVLAFVVASMWGTHKLGPKRATSDKLVPFESGIESVGNARSPFSIKYFLVAILFVLFDVEVVFMYPWAVNFRQLGAGGLWDMFLFIALFLAGFFYIIKKGALDWE